MKLEAGKEKRSKNFGVLIFLNGSRPGRLGLSIAVLSACVNLSLRRLGQEDCRCLEGTYGVPGQPGVYREILSQTRANKTKQTRKKKRQDRR